MIIVESFETPPVKQKNGSSWNVYLLKLKRRIMSTEDVRQETWSTLFRLKKFLLIASSCLEWKQDASNHNKEDLLVTRNQKADACRVSCLLEDPWNRVFFHILLLISLDRLIISRSSQQRNPVFLLLKSLDFFPLIQRIFQLNTPPKRTSFKLNITITTNTFILSKDPPLPQLLLAQLLREILPLQMQHQWNSKILL